jgi:hypothetical protein
MAVCAALSTRGYAEEGDEGWPCVLLCLRVDALKREMKDGHARTR